MSISRLGRLGVAVAAALLCALSLAPLFLLATPAAAQEVRSIDVNGASRSYIYWPGDPERVIVMFHGGGGNADIAIRTRVDDYAVANGYTLYSLQGLNGRWRYGGDMTRAAERESGDDLAFFRALGLDPEMLALVGVSAGGMMAYRIACEIDGIDALAGVSTTMQVTSCPMAEGTSLLHLHGSADTEVPYGGGSAGFFNNVYYQPVENALLSFAAANGCTRSYDDFLSQLRPAPDTREWSATCPLGTVTLSYVDGGTHTWFAPPSLDATARIFAFLAQH